MRKRLVFLATAGAVVTIAAGARADFINTNSVSIYDAFALGATVQDFESVPGKTPLSINSYASTTVPASAQLGGQIPGLHFHSGGANRNDLTNNPGTPAALLQLTGGIAGDARSGSNVVSSLAINTEDLDVTQFIELIFTNGPVDRVGAWLNPSLGNALFSAFDAEGNQLESGTGTAGNFVGFQRSSADIAFISIINTGNGFTIDDLTYGAKNGGGGGTTAIPEPGTLSLILAGALPLLGLVRRKKRGA